MILTGKVSQLEQEVAARLRPLLESEMDRRGYERPYEWREPKVNGGAILLELRDANDRPYGLDLVN